MELENDLQKTIKISPTPIEIIADILKTPYDIAGVGVLIAPASALSKMGIAHPTTVSATISILLMSFFQHHLDFFA